MENDELKEIESKIDELDSQVYDINEKIFVAKYKIKGLKDAVKNQYVEAVESEIYILECLISGLTSDRIHKEVEYDDLVETRNSILKLKRLLGIYSERAN